MLMTVVELASARLYWSADFGYSLNAETMTCDRWQGIKNSLHFKDNSTIFSRILSRKSDRCLTTSKEEFLAVDHKLILIKARTSQIKSQKLASW